MSIISKLVESSSVDANNVADYNGGGFISESGIYDLTVKRAWVIESEKGSIGIHVEFGGEASLEQDFYVTNKDKQTYFNKNGKDIAMPSYVDMKKLNYILTGVFMTSLTQLNVSEQIVKTYEWIEDPEDTTKKKKVEVQKEVEYIMDWAGKDIKVSIQMTEKEDNVKQGDKWVGTGKRAEDKDGNPYLEANIIGYYNPENNKTANEMLNDKEAEQIEKDRTRLEKAPVRVFKPKGAKASGGAKSSGTANTVVKPKVF